MVGDVIFKIVWGWVRFPTAYTVKVILNLLEYIKRCIQFKGKRTLDALRKIRVGSYLGSIKKLPKLQRRVVQWVSF